MDFENCQKAGQFPFKQPKNTFLVANATSLIDFGLKMLATGRVWLTGFLLSRSLWVFPFLIRLTAETYQNAGCQIWRYRWDRLLALQVLPFLSTFWEPSRLSPECSPEKSSPLSCQQTRRPSWGTGGRGVCSAGSRFCPRLDEPRPRNRENRIKVFVIK